MIGFDPVLGAWKRHFSTASRIAFLGGVRRLALRYNPGWCIRLALLLILLLTGCTQSATQPSIPPPTPTRAPEGTLTPYASPTASITPTATDPSTPTPLPSPTPTPRSHVVAQGEDMFGIAWRYRVTLEDLMAANPEVNPNFLSIGTVLTVPHSIIPEPSTEPPTPTPIPLELGRLTCTRTQEGGAWCFWPVHNRQEMALENVSAIIRLADREAQTILPQTAYLLLDVLPPGASLPLVTYFPPPLPDPFQFSGELLTALPNPANDGRYLPARIENQQVAIDEDGRSAVISLDVRLEDPAAAAQRVWVAAVAYDDQGRVTGVRRWENENAGPLSGDQALPVVIQVYRVAGPIQRVELFVQARP